MCMCTGNLNDKKANGCHVLIMHEMFNIWAAFLSSNDKNDLEQEIPYKSSDA